MHTHRHLRAAQWAHYVASALWLTHSKPPYRTDKLTEGSHVFCRGAISKIGLLYFINCPGILKWIKLSQCQFQSVHLQ